LKAFVALSRPQPKWKAPKASLSREWKGNASLTANKRRSVDNIENHRRSQKLAMLKKIERLLIERSNQFLPLDPTNHIAT